MKMFSLNDIDLFVQQNAAYQNRDAPNWTTEEEALNAITAAVEAERERVSEFIKLVEDLAEWSRKYHGGYIFRVANMTGRDRELVEMEKRAKNLFPTTPAQDGGKTEEE